MLTLDLPCSTRVDAGARQGGGLSPSSFPSAQKHPPWGEGSAAKGQRDHSPSDSPAPSALVQLHGELKALHGFPGAPQFGGVTPTTPGDISQPGHGAGWSKARPHREVEKGQNTPNLSPNPHPTVGLVLH